jgi:HK97 gp10 family phage protein
MADKILYNIEIRMEIDKVSDKILKALKDILRITAGTILIKARQIVPVRTGRLRDSIRIEQEDDYHYIVAPHTHYAKYVELGTVKKLPRPYMRPAADEGIKFLREAINKLKL